MYSTQTGTGSGEWPLDMPRRILNNRKSQDDVKSASIKRLKVKGGMAASCSTPRTLRSVQIKRPWSIVESSS